jgi:hypothetical protein
LYLRDELPKIEQGKLFIDAINTKLSKQESMAYKTLAAPANGISIDPSLIKYERVIGSGSYGTVWKARIGSNFVAVKKLKSENLSAKETEALRMEAESMRQLSHPRIVACIGVFSTSTEYCMVLEFW